MPFMIWGRTPLNSLRLEGNFPKLIQVLYRNFTFQQTQQRKQKCVVPLRWVHLGCHPGRPPIQEKQRKCKRGLKRKTELLIEDRLFVSGFLSIFVLGPFILLKITEVPKELLLTWVASADSYLLEFTTEKCLKHTLAQAHIPVGSCCLWKAL